MTFAPLFVVAIGLGIYGTIQILFSAPVTLYALEVRMQWYQDIVDENNRMHILYPGDKTIPDLASDPKLRANIASVAEIIKNADRRNTFSISFLCTKDHIDRYQKLNQQFAEIQLSLA